MPDLLLNNEQSRSQVIRLIQGLDIAKPWKVTWGRVVKKRSLPANSFYWKVVVTAIAEHTGHEENEIHEYLKDKFCPAKSVTLDGETRLIKSTTVLTVPEFSIYLEKCMAWGASNLGMIWAADMRGRDAA